MLQYYGGHDLDPGAARRAARARRARRRSREALAEPPRRAGRAARRRARRQAPHPRARRAQRAARARPGAAALRAPPPAAASRRSRGCSTRSASTRRRCGSSASTSQPRRHAHGRLDGRVRGRRAEEVRLPPLQDPHASRARPTTSPRWPRCSARRFAQWERQADISPHDPAYDASFAALPNLVVIDGGKGQLAAGPRRRCAGFRERGVAVVSLAKRIEEVFLPGRRDAAACSTTPRPSCSCCSACATRPTASRSPTTAAAATGDDRARCSTSCPGVGPARKRALLTHFGSPEAVLAASREELQAVPGLPAKVGARALRATCTEPAERADFTARPRARHNATRWP